MTEPTITCPKCQTEIKLTESLAAPLLEATKQDFEKRLAKKDTEMAKRETVLHEQEQALALAKENLDQQITEKLMLERDKIAAEENRKAKRRSISGEREKR